MNVCIYLRKSRSDEELEKQGKGNTLHRHREILTKLAYDKNINVTKIFEEIASGESLAYRPQMRLMLEEIEKKIFDGVMVMDMDRLGRGNMQEQGFILNVLKQSFTKIITPRKTYDLSDEFDEEYTEFEAFMARKELKIINRRMQRGRLKSIEEGNYMGSVAPFGYLVEGHGRTRRLVPHPQNGTVVKMIFEWYLEGLGGTTISGRLNNLGYLSATGRPFTHQAITNIIKNPIYMGKTTWKKRDYTKQNENQNLSSKLKSRDTWQIYVGKHEPLISEEIYNIALQRLLSKSHPPSHTKLKNPFSGLILCGECGSKMLYRPYKHSRAALICANPLCKKTKSSPFELVESEILFQMDIALKNHSFQIAKIPKANNNFINNSVSQLKAKCSVLEKQKECLYELLEQKIYDTKLFVQRKNNIDSQLTQYKNQIKQFESEKYEIYISKKMIPAPHSFVDLLLISDNNELKNQLLKCYIEKIVYKRKRTADAAPFSLEIITRF